MANITIDKELANQAVNPAALVQQAVVNFWPNAAAIEAQSECHLIKFRSEIPQSLFIDYKVKENIIAGINTEKILHIIQLCNSQSDINIRINKDKNKIIIHSGTMKYEAAKIDPRYISNVNIKYKNNLKLKLSFDNGISKLYRGVKAANKIATYCGIEFQPSRSTIILCANGDTDKLRAKIPANIMLTRLDNNIKCGQGLQNRYPLDKLVDILKIVPSNKAVKIGITRHSELVLSYPLANIGEIHFKLDNMIR